MVAERAPNTTLEMCSVIQTNAKRAKYICTARRKQFIHMDDSSAVTSPKLWQQQTYFHGVVTLFPLETQRSVCIWLCGVYLLSLSCLIHEDVSIICFLGFICLCFKAHLID